MQWFDEEFFQLGAYQADSESGKLLLGKGGTVSRVDTFSLQSEPCFYMKDFFTNEYVKYTPRETILLHRDEVPIAAVPVSFVSTENADGIYEEDFERCINSFGISLEKVVLISREEFKANNFQAAKKALFYKSLTFGAGTPYGFWHEGYGIVGSTPEVLYSVTDSKIKTFALAGTSRKGQERELLQSEKDRHEHDLVIQDLEEKLAKFCDGVQIGATGITGFKNIIHLKTDIQARLSDDQKLAALTSLLSPTAALGGYPKERSLQFLKNTVYQQRYPERFFGSAFGLVSKEFTQFLVMIRNVQWKDKTFYIESGGGVVQGSILQNEIEEFRLKRSVIRSHYL